MKATKTKFETTLNSDDFKFIIVALNDASLEIEKKKEAKKEDIFSRIKVKFQEVEQVLQSSCVVSTFHLPTGTSELGDELAQIHQIVDTVEARL
jgi:hypothetical protein